MNSTRFGGESYACGALEKKIYWSSHITLRLISSRHLSYQIERNPYPPYLQGPDPDTTPYLILIHPHMISVYAFWLAAPGGYCNEKNSQQSSRVLIAGTRSLGNSARSASVRRGTGLLGMCGTIKSNDSAKIIGPFQRETWLERGQHLS